MVEYSEKDEINLRLESINYALKFQTDTDGLLSLINFINSSDLIYTWLRYGTKRSDTKIKEILKD